jgi:hypothetical protein
MNLQFLKWIIFTLLDTTNMVRGHAISDDLRKVIVIWQNPSISNPSSNTLAANVALLHKLFLTTAKQGQRSFVGLSDHSDLEMLECVDSFIDEVLLLICASVYTGTGRTEEGFENSHRGRTGLGPAMRSNGPLSQVIETLPLATPTIYEIINVLLQYWPPPS